MKPRLTLIPLVLLLLAAIVVPRAAFAQAKKPNILIIWGDDIGIANVSAYSDGVWDLKRPNRSHCKGGHPIPPVLRRTKLHCRTRGVSHRSTRDSHRPNESWLPRRAHGHEPARSFHRRFTQESGLPPVNSVRTTSAIAMKRCPQ